MATRLTELVGIQPELRKAFTTFGDVGIPYGTPINADDAEVIITEEVLTAMAIGDTVTFDGVVYTKAAALDAEDKEFATAANLATLISATDDWSAVVTSNDVVITAEAGGIVFNNVASVSTSTVVTANGDVAVKASTTITAAAIGELNVGDTVTFDRNVFTMVTATPGATEFTDLAGLIALIDALDDWEAVEDTGAIDITAAVVGADWNDYTAVLTYNLVTAGGINGTEAVPGAVATDGTNIYVCALGNTVNTKNWKKVQLATL